MIQMGSNVVDFPKYSINFKVIDGDFLRGIRLGAGLREGVFLYHVQHGTKQIVNGIKHVTKIDRTVETQDVDDSFLANQANFPMPSPQPQLGVEEELEFGIGGGFGFFGGGTSKTSEVFDMEGALQEIKLEAYLNQGDNFSSNEDIRHFVKAVVLAGSANQAIQEIKAVGNLDVAAVFETRLHTGGQLMQTTLEQMLRDYYKLGTVAVG